MAARRSSRRRTHAPSDVQRNRGRKGQKKRKAAYQEKNHGRGNQAGIARSAPPRGRVLQGVKRSPCNVLPERPSRHHRAGRLAARMAHEGQTISVSVHHTHRHHPESRLWISNRPIPRRFEPPQTAAPRRCPSWSDFAAFLASEKSPFWTLFACTEGRQGATVTACEPSLPFPFLRFHPGGPTFRPASRDAVFP